MPLFKFKCGLCSSSCPLSKLALFLELKRPTLESQPLDLGGSNRKIPPRNGVENRQELFLEKHRALFIRCLLMRRTRQIRQIRESMRSRKKIQFHEALVRAKRFASRPLNSARCIPPNLKVPAEGLEPTHPCGYQILSLARLPIPPHRLRLEKK
jgi:hypothetical protein